MATRKTYQSNHFITHDTYVDVNGKKIQVLFRGGSLKPRINGKFVTNDPAVIAAMDRDAARPGAQFKCVKTEDDGSTPAKREAEVVEVMESTDQEQEKANDETPANKAPDGFASVEGIDTVQKAKDYLIKNVPGLVATKIPNGAAVRKCAFENKIFFVDLL